VSAGGCNSTKNGRKCVQLYGSTTNGFVKLIGWGAITVNEQRVRIMARKVRGEGMNEAITLPSK